MHLSSELPSPDLDNSLNDTELLPDVAAERERERAALNNSHLTSHGDQASARSHEPTFSSEEGASVDHGDSTQGAARSMRSPTPLSVAFSSPASALFTPTPAFQPRPRARFGAPVESTTPAYPTTTPQQHTVRFESDIDETPKPRFAGVDAEEDDSDAPAEVPNDPTTPDAHAHKRSFLLSVINSTARPRMRYPTPHHNRIPSDESQAQVTMTPGVNLRSAFAGVTPRVPRPRLSQPTPQLVKPTSDSGSGSESPYDHAVDRASFVSTASSHDLAVHARANASFDPVMGLAERGHGVGRFNAGKLNSYLHGLNRRLQEENEALVARLRTYEERSGEGSSPGSALISGTSTGTGVGSPASQSASTASQGRRASGGRRVSAGPSLGLGDVVEEAAEGWLEEKATFEEMIEELKEELDVAIAEKAKTDGALQAEREERARDRERFHERIGEVSKGVERIVADLEKRVEEAEAAAQRAEEDRAEGIKDAEERLAVVIVEKEVLAERLRKAEAALESGRELGAEVNAAHEELARAHGELENARRQISELEDAVVRSEERLDDVEGSLSAERKRTAALEEELREKMEDLSDAVQGVERLEEDLRKSRTRLRQAEDAIAQNDADAAADAARIIALEKEVDAAKESLKRIEAELEEERQENDRLIDDSEKAAELGRQMEEALEAAEKKMLEDEQEVATLKVKITSLERAVEKVQERSSMFQTGPSQSAIAHDAQAEIEVLESELDDANKEIARLRTMLVQSPARRAIERAKDARIELLEKEKEDLLERVKAMRNQSIAFNSPVRAANGSGMSPLHRQLLNMSLKSPKTPGGPLRDVSH